MSDYKTLYEDEKEMHAEWKKMAQDFAIERDRYRAALEKVAGYFMHTPSEINYIAVEALKGSLDETTKERE